MQTQMTKKDVQKRVLQNGKPLALSKFKWDSETRTFSSKENDLVIDFTGKDDCTFKAGWLCTFRTGSGCTFETHAHCMFIIGGNCFVNTYFGSTFDVGERCRVIRQDILEIIRISNEKITLCPEDVPGYIKDGIHSVTGTPAIIVGSAFGEVLYEVLCTYKVESASMYQVIEYNKDTEEFLIEEDGKFTLRSMLEVYNSGGEISGSRVAFQSSCMTKEGIQKRVTQFGKPLALWKFKWDNTRRRFTSTESYLDVNFSQLDGCTIKAGCRCTILTGDDCTVLMGCQCKVIPKNNCTVRMPNTKEGLKDG